MGNRGTFRQGFSTAQLLLQLNCWILVAGTRSVSFRQFGFSHQGFSKIKHLFVCWLCGTVFC